MEFLDFPKIARLSREIFITEKIDGTNAQIAIMELEGFPVPEAHCICQKAGLAMFVGSRTRWITPEDDNYGFARWCVAHQEELMLLGPGRHFGEWWGQGIQRNYGMKEKLFSLFNVDRWADNTIRPFCCSVVPTLYRGNFHTEDVERALELLQVKGSQAAPGFMKPEGVIIYHTAGRVYFKKTILKDEEPKSMHGGA
jgi:hypothetical protein